MSMQSKAGVSFTLMVSDWINSLTCHFPHMPVGDSSTQFEGRRQHFLSSHKRETRDGKKIWTFNSAGLFQRCAGAVGSAVQSEGFLSVDFSEWWVYNSLPARPPRCYQRVDEHTHHLTGHLNKVAGGWGRVGGRWGADATRASHRRCQITVCPMHYSLSLSLSPQSGCPKREVRVGDILCDSHIPSRSHSVMLEFQGETVPSTPTCLFPVLLHVLLCNRVITSS